MMAALAIPMYGRWIEANFFGFTVSGSCRALHFAGEAALIWALWTAFLHCGGAACAALFAFFTALEFAPAVLCRSLAGPVEFSYLCLFPVFWTLTACVLAIPVRGRIAVRAKRMWAIVPFSGVTQYLIYLAYVLKFGHQPSAEMLMTLFSTNFGEARDFLVDQIGLLPIATGVVVIGAAWLVVRALASHVRPACRASVAVVLCALCLGTALCVRNQDHAIADKGLITAFRKSYRQYQAAFESLKRAHSDSPYQISNMNVTKEGTGEICVVVIGESATRRHMGRYGYERPTTPWLCSEDENLQKSLFVLENAYSCMTSTVPAVTMALSQFSNYDKFELIPEENREERLSIPEVTKSFSLIEILEGAGVRTHWFSNQAKLGTYNTPISAQAREANEQEFLEDLSPVDRENGHQDEELLPMLEHVLNSTGGGMKVMSSSCICAAIIGAIKMTLRPVGRTCRRSVRMTWIVRWRSVSMCTTAASATRILF